MGEKVAQKKQLNAEFLSASFDCHPSRSFFSTQANATFLMSAVLLRKESAFVRTQNATSQNAALMRTLKAVQNVHISLPLWLLLFLNNHIFQSCTETSKKKYASTSLRKKQTSTSLWENIIRCFWSFMREMKHTNCEQCVLAGKRPPLSPKKHSVPARHLSTLASRTLANCAVHSWYTSSVKVSPGYEGVVDVTGQKPS